LGSVLIWTLLALLCLICIPKASASPKLFEFMVVGEGELTGVNRLIRIKYAILDQSPNVQEQFASADGLELIPRNPGWGFNWQRKLRFWKESDIGRMSTRSVPVRPLGSRLHIPIHVHIDSNAFPEIFQPHDGPTLFYGVKLANLNLSDSDSCPLIRFYHLDCPLSGLKLAGHNGSLPCNFIGLSLNLPPSPIEKQSLYSARDHQTQIEQPNSPIPPYIHGGQFANRYGLFCIFGSYAITFLSIPIGGIFIDRGFRVRGWCFIGTGLTLGALASASGAIGCLPWDWWRCLHDGPKHSQRDVFHGGNNVSQKYLTNFYLCNTVIGMANVLNTDKQIAVIGALAEGSSIRSIERITGVHRDTVMRLGVRVGKGCAALMDVKMRDLGCRYLEFDEIWGFIGKKEKNLTVDDGPECGDAWTFCAVDAETKLVPAFKVGKRDGATANEFVQDVANRMKNRVQISTDGLRAYVEAIESAFGKDVDYAQIVKTYIHDESGHPNRRYSAPDIVSTEKKWFAGRPDMRHVSTSYVERLNATTRLHMRRLTRLTLAFSKKRENFEAAVALHFAYYNFVKRHNTVRCTPAMAAGVERDFWSVGNLVEAAA
jgi:IS1 family transposase